MDLVAVGPPDEAFLLDLLNTTPVVDGIAHVTISPICRVGEGLDARTRSHAHQGGDGGTGRGAVEPAEGGAR